MHEVSLALEVLDLLTHHPETAGAPRLLNLKIRVGALSGVDPDALQFALESLAEGTLLEDAQLELIRIPGSAHCPACCAQKTIEFQLSPCPDCGHFPLTEIEGTDLVIQDIECPPHPLNPGGA